MANTDQIRSTLALSTVPTFGTGWRRQAAGQGLNLDLFFPIGDGSDPNAPEVRVAKVICDTCPVRQPCLDWALHTGAEFGIYGGRTGHERRALRLGTWRSRQRRR